MADTPSFLEDLDFLKAHADGFPPDTTVAIFTRWLADTMKTNLAEPTFVRDYLPILQSAPQDPHPPFLSVIMRTQGRRPEELREALLCLQAQSDQDFELLLVGHKLGDAQRATIAQILQEQPVSFQRRIRFLPLSHGERATPLNFALAHARGTYASAFDDDDLLFENWVEEFHRAGEAHPGTVLHAYAVSQKWMMIQTPGGDRAARATSAFEKTYCAKFDMITEICINSCPLNSLAFPVAAFAKMGFAFDETLTTTEDWDYFMRLAFCFGVSDIETPTAIYRLWTNAENSQTQHQSSEWDKNYGTIQEKFLKTPILLKPGYSTFLRQIVLDRGASPGSDGSPSRAEYDAVYSAYMGVIHSKSWRITAPLRACLTGYLKLREKLGK